MITARIRCNWPKDGDPTHVDELGNPLPYGVTRSLGNGKTLTPTTTSDLDPTIKEDLPTIEQALHAWEKANGLPETALTITAGTNGTHGDSGLSQHYVGGAIDIQLPKNMTPDQYDALADTMHTYLPGFRVGLNEGTAKAPAAVGTADFLDPGSPTHLHLDLKNIPPLQDIQNSGTMHVLPDLNLPSVNPNAKLASVSLQTPTSPTFIADDSNVVTPGDNVIAAVDLLHPIHGFKSQYDVEIARGITPGHAIADMLKTLIG